MSHHFGYFWLTGVSGVGKHLQLKSSLASSQVECSETCKGAQSEGYDEKFTNHDAGEYTRPAIRETPEFSVRDIVAIVLTFD